jgi:NMD protein affecting ribosome stability and mRNA decay
MVDQIIGEESVCPSCKGMLNMGVDIGDSFLYDICGNCGLKRKKKKTGEVVEMVSLAETIRHAESKRKDEGRELV